MGHCNEACEPVKENATLRARVAELEKLDTIVRQLWDDWQSGYDALASDQWEQLRKALDSGGGG